VGQASQFRTIGRLGELVEFCANWTGPRPLFVRWTPDCHRDLDSEGSVDELTGTPLPGLSANGLAVEPWWQDRRPLEGWIARRLYDYRHLVELRGEGTRPWVLTGDEVGRGPDNEPLIGRCEVVAAIDSEVIDEAVALVDAMPADWGSLRRR
jgi:hypothetical protein